MDYRARRSILIEEDLPEKLQLTLEQHGIELYGPTYMQIFSVNILEQFAGDGQQFEKTLRQTTEPRNTKKFKKKLGMS